MTVIPPRFRRFLEVLFRREAIRQGGLCLLLTVAGCGGQEGRVPVFPVAGQVKIDGETPEGALVVLYPSQKGSNELRPSGKVGRDGSFTLTTYDADDGAPAGDYVATIQWNKLVKRGNDYVAGPNAVPKVFGNAESSPWKIRIAASSNDLGAYEIRK